MKTRSSLQRRTAEAGDRLVANLQPRRFEQAQFDSPQPTGHDFSHVDLFSHTPQRSTIQAKLTVGAANDQYEDEADRVAQQVMRMPESPQVQREMAPEDEEALQTKPLAATITPLVQREAMPEEEEEPIQAKRIQREATPEEEKPVQAKPDLQRSADGSLQAGENLESQLNSSKGGGSPLPKDVQTFMESRLRTDFSQVRVHTGSEAVQMNRELHAQAFTHGSNIYFGEGKTPGNDALTAHELTHVVQQGGALARKPDEPDTLQQKGQGLPSTAIGPAIQRVAVADIQRDVVETYGGKFETVTYEDASGRDASGFIDHPSAKIELEFWANELVDCPKIGMTQTTNAHVDGAPAPVRAEVTGRSTTLEDHGEEGRYLDRAAQRENPMYGVNNQAAGTLNPQLGDGANAANSRWGHRTVLPDGTVDEAEAYLYDKPSRNRAVTDAAAGKGQTVSHQFETTALCVEGELAGTYLGSVQWGYQVDADNNYSLTPFAVVSMGAPTQQFMAAAQLWNDATVDMGGGATADTIDLPITSHQTVDPTTLNDEQLFHRIRELADEIQAMQRDERRRRTPDYQNRRFEARGLAREASRRGAVAADSGKTYTVQSGDTLWRIAATKLGSGVKWTQIFALNVIDILDPNLIFPGQTLKMPEPYAG